MSPCALIMTIAFGADSTTWRKRSSSRLRDGNVDDGREHHRSLFGLDRVQADLDRKLAAVFFQAVEIATGTHGARHGIVEERVTQAGMLLRKRSGTSISMDWPSISSRA